MYVRNIKIFLVFCRFLSVQYIKCRVVQVNIWFSYDSWNLTIGNNIIYVFVIHGIHRYCTRNGFPDRRRPTHHTQTDCHASCNIHAAIQVVRSFCILIVGWFCFSNISFSIQSTFMYPTILPSYRLSFTSPSY